MLYPLKFHPHLRFYPFGGYKIGTFFPHKEDIPRERTVAESWEVSACPGAESVIKNGPLAGLNLQEVVDKLQSDLVGEAIWNRYGNYFPLLIKFLDAAKDLPPQVHPDDEYAAQAGLPFRGKTEAWYILQTDTAAGVWCGSKEGMTEAEFREMIVAEKSFDAMKRILTHPGEVYYIPAGRLHAIGAGNFIVEVQQNSDAVFAWDWLDWDVGDERRQSDKEHSVRCALLEDGEPEKTVSVIVRKGANVREYLMACRYFIMEKLNLRATWSELGVPQRFEAWVPTRGRGRLLYNGDQSEVIQAGESLLIPAKLGLRTVEPEGELELIRAIPTVDLRLDLIEPLRANGISLTDILALGGYGRGNDLIKYFSTKG